MSTATLTANLAENQVQIVKQQADIMTTATSSAMIVGGGGGIASGTSQQQSPRNTPTMANVQLGYLDVPKSLQDGEKFVKWDEVSPAHIRCLCFICIMFECLTLVYGYQIIANIGVSLCIFIVCSSPSSILPLLFCIHSYFIKCTSP